MATSARPPLYRGQTMPTYLPTTTPATRNLSALEDAVAALQFPQGSREAVRRVLSDQGSLTTLSTVPSTPSLPKLPAIFACATPRDNNKAPSTRLQVLMALDSQPSQHVLSAPLGSSFSSECITIAAKKGSVLVIVADRWDAETDCHYEWKIHFDRDVDMAKIQAQFNQGLLKVTVPRFRTY